LLTSYNNHCNNWIWFGGGRKTSFTSMNKLKRHSNENVGEPLICGNGNNPKLDWGGHARNMCIEKKQAVYVGLIQVQCWSSVNSAKDFHWGKSRVFFSKCVMKAWNFMVENLEVWHRWNEPLGRVNLWSTSTWLSCWHCTKCLQ
jgi:hypothetical protein